MKCGASRRIGFAALALAAALAAQLTPRAAPKFEVVSIREIPLNAPPVSRDIDFTPVLPGGQYIDSRTSLLFMISFAWNMKNPAVQMIGLPNWAEKKVFAAAAKAGRDFPRLPPTENREQVRLMMRAMLADRFHLRLHTETRQARIFELKVGKGGIKIKEVAPPAPPAREGPVGAAMGDRSGRMIGHTSTMTGIAGALTLFLKAPVVDRTGLTGYYDFDVKWSAGDIPDGQPDFGFGAEGPALLMSALQNQLGLRLKGTAGPVEYWVVDHVEEPTGN